MDNTLEILKASNLFKDFSDSVLERFVASAELKSFKAEEIIFVQMSEGREIYLINSGEVSIQVALANEDDHYEMIKLGPGDLLGEVRFIDDIPRSGTAIALTDGEMLVWDNAIWREICASDYQVGYRLTLGIAKILCARLRRWNVQIVDHVDWGML